MAKLRSIVPHALLPSAQATKRLLLQFADRAGMVYFGYVSQRSDDHHIVRGLTVSTKHIDDHYCIGTYEGYDVIFVERSDSLHSGKRHVWHILEFDLKSKTDIPHAFIGSGTHGHGFHELLATKYSAMKALPLGATNSYPTSFTSHFQIYATPAYAVAIETLIPPVVAETLGAHFKGLVAEITNDALYIYSEKPHLSADLLDTMLQNGVWLAQMIDTNSRQL